MKIKKPVDAIERTAAGEWKFIRTVLHRPAHHQEN